MATVDLHLHTTASDGNLSPTELINLLDRRGLKIVAITDHDSTDGIIEAQTVQASIKDLTLIPGIELSADAPGTEVHILGYFLRWEDSTFQQVLKGFRDDRLERTKEMVDVLSKLGINLEIERILQLADGAVGRPHIAQAMIEKGYVKDNREAFDKYLGREGSAYVSRTKFLPQDAIELIHSVGGVSVLAHPTFVNNLEDRLAEMVEAGLVGIEVYYSGYEPGVVKDLAELAARFELIPCGGSDYHAFGVNGETLPGEVGPPEASVMALEILAASKITAKTPPLA
ncbi:PHP domain-containing protein [SAR202 cluster bacterium AD-804-J14_MRT_500m]|nr:PHP domain-containing protein [SAR202 cluster bacterium AD-804-J14_MRT_500m]